MALSQVTDTAGAGTLEEITVTAQRKEQNSQSVPISIAAVSGDDLNDRGATNIQTLSAAVPNLTMTVTTSNTNTYIRGVGTTSATVNNEPSAATYIDGVYMPSSFGLTSLYFNNIERLEVLKGPQGTLFGRNSTAGVIQVITPDPEHERRGTVGLGYGNYDAVYGNVYLTGGISENLAADVSLIHEDQGEGWGYNPTYETDIFWHRNTALRTKWLYTPADSTTITAVFDYSKFESDGSNFAMVEGSVSSVDGVTTFPGEYNAVGEVNVTDNEQYGASLRIDQQIGALQGVSITSYRSVKGNFLIDSDITPAQLIAVNSTNDSDYVTQEFHLSSQQDSIEWLVGAFFYANDVHGADPRINYGMSVADQFREIRGRQETRSVSGFGQATLEIVENTNLTFGLRYTLETQSAEGLVRDPAGEIVSGPSSDENSFDPWTWRIALDRQFTPDLLGYVSYNRGFKSGGYNLNSPGSPSFDPETVDAYELGLKSELLDRRLRLNAAAFYYDYKDLQVTIVPGGGVQLFTNAAAARIYGFEAAVDVAATDSLTLSMGLGLLDAKYADYPDTRGYTNAGVLIPISNARDREIPLASPLSGYVSGNYSVPTSSGEFKAAVSLSYQDRAFITPAEQHRRPSYELLNASVEWWSDAAEPFGIRLWGRNLTGSYYPNASVESSRGWYDTPAPPRTYGLTLMKNF